MKDLTHHDISIGLPPAWEDVSIVTLVGPELAGYAPSITVTRESVPAGTTAEQYALSQQAGLAAEFAPHGYAVVQEGPLSLGKLQAYGRRHTFAVPDAGLQVEQLQVYAVGDGLAITITCTDRFDRFAQMLPVFQEAIRRFRFLPNAR